MGLDLTLYAVPAVNDINPDDAVDKWIELAYGRKTWFIWDYFKSLDSTIMIKDDQILTIPKEAWEDFVSVLDRNRERIFDYVIFKKIKKTGFTPSAKEDIIRGQIEDIIRGQIKEAQFRKWYNDTFDTMPTLGYEWDARAMLRWLEANSEVRKYLNDPSYILLLEASY